MEKIITSIKDVFQLIGLDGKLSTLLAAIGILIIGSLIAKGIKKLVRKALKKTDIDNKLFGGEASGVKPEGFISSFVYFIIMLFVLLLVLSTLGMESVLDPVKNMLNEFLGFLPNLIAAGLIGFVGYILAKVVSNLIGLGSTFVENVASKLKVEDTGKFVAIIQKIVFAVIFIPFIIQALNALHINAISEPANGVLSTVMAMIPKVLAAGAIIAIFVIGGKYLTNFLADLLKSVGTDELANKLQLDSMIGENQSLSKILSGLAYFFLAFTGITIGVGKLDLPQLNDILKTILDLSGQIFFGLILLVMGNFIANIVGTMLSKSDDNKFIASIAKGAIIALFLAISLRTMGIANSIVEIAFTAIIGAIAVTIALAYGLGGREAAGEHMKDILNKFRKK